ncbi:membrane protein insertion efficiency factor YidD [Aquabacterium sp.]|uniref:membrane protein insertion efficiency factor YidD n=1 Tax=Aquabacterium sp. TaxID=1872578 RepID=UPI0035AE6B01
MSFHPVQSALIALIRGYRFFFSPWVGSACRFEPTCSQYALQALRQHGATGGSYLAARRLLRCHPWCDGGHDPVPARLPGLFTSLSNQTRTEPSDAAAVVPSQQESSL